MEKEGTNYSPGLNPYNTVRALPPFEAPLSSMLHDLAEDLPASYHRLQLLRQRTFLVVIIFSRSGNVNIDSRAFARKDLRVETFLG